MYARRPGECSTLRHVISVVICARGCTKHAATVSEEQDDRQRCVTSRSPRQHERDLAATCRRGVDARHDGLTQVVVVIGDEIGDRGKQPVENGNGVADVCNQQGLIRRLSPDIPSCWFCYSSCAFNLFVTFAHHSRATTHHRLPKYDVHLHPCCTSRIVR